MSETLSLTALVGLAGWLHFCQVPAMMVAPRMLGWDEDLARMQPINRRIFRVMATAIMLTVLGLGLVVGLSPAQVADGSRLGTSLAGFLAVFWTYRGAVQVLVYSRIWPQGILGILSHYGLTALFSFLAGVYWMVLVSGVLR